jgi:hypothetical protein
LLLFDSGKVDIHLITIDAIKSGSNEAVTDKDARFLPDEEWDGLTLKDKLASWHNYYQQDDKKTVWNGITLFNGDRLRGAPLAGAGAADNLNKAEGDLRVNHHLRLPADIWKTIMRDLGLPIPAQ